MLIHRIRKWFRQAVDKRALVAENNDLREERDELIVARKILWQRIGILIADRDRIAEMVGRPSTSGRR